MLRHLLLAAIVSLLWPMLLAAADAALPAEDPPPVFDRRPYEEAKAAAVKDKKWFLVKATASWCGPCKQMDKTTWRDEQVVAWLKDHAVAVQLDVDEQKPLSRQLDIQAM